MWFDGDEQLIFRFFCRDVGMLFIPLRFCKSKINCCRRHFVVVPMPILGSTAESRETKTYAPNSDDPYDLCACTIRLHPHPVSLRRIPTMWWTIVSMPPATKRLAMQRRECCSLDLEQCPKHCMLLRWRATWEWCESVSSGEECVWRLHCSHLRGVLRPYHRQHSVLRWWYHHTYRKNQCRKIEMSLLNLLKFCDLYLWWKDDKKHFEKLFYFMFSCFVPVLWCWKRGKNYLYTYHLREKSYRDLFCDGSGHQDHHRGPTPREME